MTYAHRVNGRLITPPFPDGLERAVVGMGCFWGAERMFWGHPGVWVTAVGYAGGTAPYPTYEDVCTGRTGHAEVVLVVYDPGDLPFGELMRIFWEGHDPTQGMRQGNDIGTQYRSIVLCSSEAQLASARASLSTYGATLAAAGFGPVTTEVGIEGSFWYAEDYHQQYLAKNPQGYCGLGGTGIRCPA